MDTVMLRRNAEIHPTRFAPFGSNPAETDSQATVACSWCCLQDVWFVLHVA